MNKLNLIIWTAVLLLVGAVFIAVLSDQVAIKTTKNYVFNETVNLAGYRASPDDAPLDGTIAVNLTYKSRAGVECPISSFVFRNQTGQTMIEGKDYHDLSLTTGVFYLNDTSNNINQTTSNTTKTDYYYCQEGYTQQSWARSVLNLITGFMALLLLILIIAVAWKIYKEAK